LGWLSSIAFYVLVSLLAGGPPTLRVLGAGLFCVLFGVLLGRVLRYIRFRGRLGTFRKKVAAMLAATGSDPAAAEKLATQVVQNGSDPAKVRGLLGQAGLAVEHQVTVVKLVEERIGPYLRSPVEALEHGRFAQSRFASAYVRSFALSLFVLLWFFIVPVPGLFVFTARQYRISVELAAIVQVLAWGVGLALVSYWAGLLFEGWERSRPRTGLFARIGETFREFQNAAQAPGRLSAEEISSIYALFTDVQTYLDQRSYHYARQSLEQIRRKLRLAGNS
jgi:hypothetical protein